MLRRQFNLTLLTLAIASCATASTQAARGPLFWLAMRGRARVFLLGFGEAKDKAWFTPAIERAFQQSSQLWLEVGPGPSPDNRDPSAKEADAEQIKQLERESHRTFFDVLQPSVRQSVLATMESLGVAKESVEPLRPWRAFYVINSAFWAKAKPAYQEVYVDEALRGPAVAQGKSIYYEMPTRLEFARFMSSMPDAAQSQYVEWLLAFIDDQNSGANEDPFEWLIGKPATRSLDRMRTKMPDLYRVMQLGRNAWWAAKINELLGMDGTYFIAIGELHVLGPDGIPAQLLRSKVITPSQLKENPGLERVG